jgi:intein/homing endonuclease
VLLHIEAGSEVIKVTPEHPLWVYGRGWTEAGKLRPGDGLVTASGSVVAVGDIARREGRFKVYNFEVEQAHSCFCP